MGCDVLVYRGDLNQFYCVSATEFSKKILADCLGVNFNADEIFCAVSTVHDLLIPFKSLEMTALSTPERSARSLALTPLDASCSLNLTIFIFPSLLVALLQLQYQFNPTIAVCQHIFVVITQLFG